MDYNPGTVLDFIICTIRTCVNFICMCKVCKEHLKVMLKVLLLLHAAYTSPCHWSLLVIVWLHLVPTNITRISSDTTVLEGDNLQLTCEALGRPEPNITWTTEKFGNQGNTGVVQEEKVLNITNINRSDAGTFTCTAYNGFGKKESLTVHVNVTCECALKKCLNNVKQRCTFLLFSMLQCTVLSITWINVWPSTSMQGSKLKFLKNHLLATFSFKMVTII